jgi:hypothetical protein
LTTTHQNPIKKAGHDPAFFALHSNGNQGNTMDNAERQRLYRANRPTAGENGERRINTFVSTGAKLALTRLAARYAVTEREMLQRLIVDAEAELTGPMTDSEFEAYQLPALRSNR